MLLLHRNQHETPRDLQSLRMMKTPHTLYFVEQATLCQVTSFFEALYVWFSAHYIFHLSYCESLVDMCTFIQGLPAAGKKSATYLTTATDIQQLTIR